MTNIATGEEKQSMKKALSILVLGFAGFAAGIIGPVAQSASAKEGGISCRRCEFSPDSLYEGYSCMPADFGGLDCIMWKEGGIINCLTFGTCASRVRGW
jgi:hypothetical protein